MNFIKYELSNKKYKYGIIIFLILIIGFFVYKNINGNDSKMSDQEVITAEVNRGNIKDTVSASGQIETANFLTVTTSVNGIVEEVYVREGDSVMKGQSIMKINLNSEGEENLASAWSSYLSAKNSLESAKIALTTYESTLINAEEDFEDEKENNSYQTHDERVAFTLAENDVEVALANYDNQKEAISQKQTALNKAWLTYQAQSPTIVAPDSGVVANIVVVQGMEITNSLSERTSSTVASIRKEGSPIASLNISEIDINKIQVGQKVEITLNSVKDKIFIGEVVGIDRIGVASSGVPNYPVIVKFDEDSDAVLPNMGVDAEVIIQEKENILYVPSSAIISMRGNTMVRAEGGEEGELTRVETGIETNEYTEIISGLEEGSIVFISTLPTSGFTAPDDEQGQGGNSRGIFPGIGGGRR